MSRTDGRKYDELRKVKFLKNVNEFAEGSCYIEFGKTKIICTATVEDKVPHFMRDQGRGWVTAEYGMLPRCSPTRIPRESSRGRVSGRTHEIQRLIGRSLRSVIDLNAIGERTIWIDCDVMQADGGTRTASITGSFIALVLALHAMKKKGAIKSIPIDEYVAAISCGIVGEDICLDLCYEEDSTAEVDMNLVMTESQKIIEIQGTAEGKPFSYDQMNDLLTVGKKGIAELINLQKSVLEEN